MTYTNRDPAYGRLGLAMDLAAYESQAEWFRSGIKITSDAKHVYADGIPIADAVGPMTEEERKPSPKQEQNASPVQPPDEGERIVKSKEACHLLACCVGTLDNLVKRGALTAFIMPGNKHRSGFYLSEIRKLMQPK